LSGKGAKVQIDVLVSKTDRFTVEFWFKSDVSVNKNLQCNYSTTQSTKPLSCDVNNPGENNTGLNATITGKYEYWDKKTKKFEKAMSPLFCNSVDKKMKLKDLYCQTTNLTAGSLSNITSTVKGYYYEPKTNIK